MELGFLRPCFVGTRREKLDERGFVVGRVEPRGSVASAGSLHGFLGRSGFRGATDDGGYEHCEQVVQAAAHHPSLSRR